MIGLFKYTSILIAVVLLPNLRAKDARNLLQKEVDAIDLSQHLVSADAFLPLPKYADDKAWAAIDADLKQHLIQAGDAALETDWGHITASLYRTYRTTGNRTLFQKVYFRRRQKLVALVQAEMVERKGRFINEIIDGVWMICEESSWVLHAHAGGRLHYGETIYNLDLFSAQTGALLAWIHYFLGHELNRVTPKVTERIRSECRRRIITPGLKRKLWWMSKGSNWNAWICSNWLATLLILEKDPKIREQSVRRIISCLDNFVNYQATDGACSEGTHYWSEGVARLLQSLYYLKTATSGKVDVFEEPYIQSISSFYQKAHMGKNYFVNFGDGSHTVNVGMKVFHLAKHLNDPLLMRVAKASTLHYDPLQELTSRHLATNMMAILNYNEFRTYVATEVPKRESWFPDLQLMCSSLEMNEKDVHFWALGAHNGQYHNHNDVGQYSLFVDGHPALIDVGVNAYSKKNSSSKRYDIWTMQSDFHNLPTINGAQQSPGRKRRASRVTYEKGRLSMNLATAYPESAKVVSWIRTFQLGNDAISVTDDFELQERRGAVILNHMTPLDVTENEDGVLSLERDGSEVLSFTYDSEQLSLELETIKLEGHLKGKWNQPTLKRIRLTLKGESLKGQIVLRLQ